MKLMAEKERCQKISNNPIVNKEEMHQLTADRDEEDEEEKERERERERRRREKVG